MKKILSNIYTLAALCMMGAATFMACSSDNAAVEQKPEQPTGKTYTMTVNASKGMDTRALTLDGSTLNATWNEGEIVEVYQSGSKIGELTAAASTDASTTLTGSFAEAPSTSANLMFYFHSNATPSYSGQDGTLETIASTYDFCAPATVTVGNFTVDAVKKEISVPGGISFGANQQAIVKFTLQDKASDADLSASILSIEVNGYIYAIIPASATNVFYVALPEISNKKVSLFAKTAAGWYSYNRANVSFANGEYYAIGAKLTQTGMLPGVFSVGASETVRFSQGNLQATYNGSAWTWAFAADQYSHVGFGAANSAITGNGTITSTGTVDLFGWSTNATYYGIHDSYDESTYSGDFVDWGTNAITNGGNSANMWSTLTKDQWTYIINNHSYAKAYLFGTTQGVILLPDHYTHPNDVPDLTGVNDATSSTSWYHGNEYDTEQWAKMEAAGAVFLPSAGWRVGTSVRDAGYDGSAKYWSSTTHPSVATAAYDFVFGYDNLKVGASYRLVGESVRLVKTVE